MTVQCRCPDCDVRMEKTTLTTEGIGGLYIETERDGGVLDRLGIGSQTPVDAVLCPDCGLTRLYADLSQ